MQRETMEYDVKSTAQQKLDQLKQMLAAQRSRLEQTVEHGSESLLDKGRTLLHDHPAEIIAGVGVGAYLLGKLLGEPAMAYLLAIASIPLAAWACLRGGVTPDVLMVVYVNLATTTLLCGACGLVGRVRPTTGEPVAATFLAMFAMVTPAPLFYALTKAVSADVDPWLYGLSLYGWEVPFLWIVPPLQLLLAFLFFHGQVRQLINPINPPLGKKLAYVILAVVDIGAAAALFESGPGANGLGFRAALFCLVHLLAGCCLIMRLTPWRETLHSWVWRYRGQWSRLRDGWLCDRSENGLAVWTLGALGVVSLALFVLLPAILVDGAELPETYPVLIASAATALVLMLVFGAAHQWFVLAQGRSAAGGPILLGIAAAALPVLAARLDRFAWMLPLSPASHFWNWLNEEPFSLDFLPMLVGYVAVFFWFRALVRRRLHRLGETVDEKLRQMGVLNSTDKGKGDKDGVGLGTSSDAG